VDEKSEQVGVRLAPLGLEKESGFLFSLGGAGGGFGKENEQAQCCLVGPSAERTVPLLLPKASVRRHRGKLGMSKGVRG